MLDPAVEMDSNSLALGAEPGYFASACAGVAPLTTASVLAITSPISLGRLAEAALAVADVPLLLKNLRRQPADGAGAIV